MTKAQARQAKALRALDAAVEAFRAAGDALDAAATAYARAGTLAYSEAHPRREVTLCAAMGSTCLHVSGAPYGGNYQLRYTDSARTPAPEFIDVLGDIESEFNFGHALGGPLRLKCKGGAILDDATDW